MNKEKLILVALAPPRPHWFQGVGIPDAPPYPAFKDRRRNSRLKKPDVKIERAVARYEAWEMQAEQERDLQWPLWWADEMLKRLGGE